MPAAEAVPTEMPAENPADVAVEETVTTPPKENRAEQAAEAAAVASTATPTATATATGEVAPVTGAAADSAFAGREVVYVQAPIPPRLRGNRGVGSLLAVLGAVVFAAIYAGAMIVAFYIRGAAPMDAFAEFIQNAAFWVPVLVFLVAFVLLVLVVNRAGWAAHVFGSLLVAVVVYFGSIGILLLLGQIVGATSGGAAATFSGIASQPFIIIAALVAREVSIWMGLAIAARVRRVKAKNLELVDDWENEHAETKAQYERAGATA
ncbi:hypothetical protein BH09ACT4_BH09ACT4_11950 [soil metagenome]